MSDHDRGPYTPPSERLSFDPREPVRSGGPAPVTLIVSGLVLVAIIGGVFLVYSGGVRHKGNGPAAVGAPLAQIKTPAPPDAADAAASSLTVSKVDAANMTAANAAPAFAPAPEQPLPRPLPVQASPAAEAPAAIRAEAPPPAALPSSASLAATPPAKSPKPVTIATLTDAALAQKSAATAAPKPPTPPPAPPATVSSSAASPPAGAGWVQIGAFSSSALADKGWGDIVMLEPAGMAGKGKRVETVAKDGKTLYRTYITGFSTHSGAQAFCDKLKADGKSCFVK